MQEGLCHFSVADIYCPPVRNNFRTSGQLVNEHEVQNTKAGISEMISGLILFHNEDSAHSSDINRLHSFGVKCVRY